MIGARYRSNGDWTDWKWHDLSIKNDAEKSFIQYDPRFSSRENQQVRVDSRLWEACFPYPLTMGKFGAPRKTLQPGQHLSHGHHPVTAYDSAYVCTSVQTYVDIQNIQHTTYSHVCIDIDIYIYIDRERERGYTRWHEQDIT